MPTNENHQTETCQSDNAWGSYQVYRNLKEPVTVRENPNSENRKKTDAKEAIQKIEDTKAAIGRRRHLKSIYSSIDRFSCKNRTGFSIQIPLEPLSF